MDPIGRTAIACIARLNASQARAHRIAGTAALARQPRRKIRRLYARGKPIALIDRRTKRPLVRPRHEHAFKKLPLVANERIRLPRPRDTPLFEHNYLVGAQRLDGVVRHHDDADTPLPCQTADQRTQLRTLGTIDHRERLIEHEVGGLHGKHAGKRQALLLPARKGVDLARAVPCKSHGLKSRIDSHAHLKGREPEVLRTKTHLVRNYGGHQLICGVLHHKPHHTADLRARVRLRAIKPLADYRPRLRQKRASKQAAERRLTRPIAAHECHKLSRRHRERHTLEHRLLTI